MNSFHDIRFPIRIAFGATGGPERRNEIVQLSSGLEKRNTRQKYSRRRYDVGTGLRSLEDMYEVVSFFEARRGSLHAFRFRDPFDMKSCFPNISLSPTDQIVGSGDGQQKRFPLIKSYGLETDDYKRRITKPVAETVVVSVEGDIQFKGSDYSIDPEWGDIVFADHAIPANGAIVTAGYEFDVKVRFDTDQIFWSIDSFRAGQIPSIPLMEVI